MSIRYDLASLDCSPAQPCELVASSRDLGWSDILVDFQRSVGRSDSFDTHRTSDLTVVLALSGRSTVRVHKNGRWHNAVYDVGAAGLTPRHEITRLNWEVERPDRHVDMSHFYISDTLIRETAEEFRRIGSHDSEQSLNALVFRDATLQAIGIAMVRAMMAGAPDFYAEQASSFMAVHLLSRHAQWWDADADNRSLGPNVDRRIARAIDYMSANLHMPISLASVAMESGMSRYHLVRQFRHSTGSTPFGYLNALRLELAQRLLRTTDLPVGEIGRRCGFPRASTFSNAFLRYAGVSPAAFRGAPHH